MAESSPSCVATRHDWSRDEIRTLLEQPFNDLLFQAHHVHRQSFQPNKVQISTLLSIKTGACPEDCAYCPQSTRFDTGLTPQELMDIDQVVSQALKAKEAGSSRFCMGAAWRSPKDRQLPVLTKMVKEVKALGLETCMTLGMLTYQQASALAEAGLDYYNHNLDTSPEYYGEIITTRCYQDRLDTLNNVRSAGMKVCCGGIIGMGEQVEDRVGLLQQLANLPTHPESVPINALVRVAGTPLAAQEDIDPIEFVRVIAVARILMPRSWVRLSAGRETMDDATQALSFFAGANSLFCGEKLLTTPNPAENQDRVLFTRLGIEPVEYSSEAYPAKASIGEATGNAKRSQFYNAVSH
jgi:biotin synthase